MSKSIVKYSKNYTFSYCTWQALRIQLIKKAGKEILKYDQQQHELGDKVRATREAFGGQKRDFEALATWLRNMQAREHDFESKFGQLLGLGIRRSDHLGADC